MVGTLAFRLALLAMNTFIRYILNNKPLWFFIAFGALTTYVLWPFYPAEAGLRDEWVGSVAIEGFGFLMDIILFGLLWSVFDVYREGRAKIRGYRDELKDFVPWKAQEGVLRKVGLIRRLNELRASLPMLGGIHLEGARLSNADLLFAFLAEANLKDANLAFADLGHASLYRANLEGAVLRKANLKGAHLLQTNLEGAHLKEADLKGVDLRSSNLAGAKDLTWDQLKEVRTNNKTILPTYLKENAPESYKGRFAGEKWE